MNEIKYNKEKSIFVVFIVINKKKYQYKIT